MLEWVVFGFLYEREHLQQVLMTCGLILVFEEFRSLLVGDGVHGAEVPAILAGTIPLGEIWRVVGQIRASGIATLIVDRDYHKVLAQADRAFGLQKGRVVLQGAADDLQGNARVAAFLGV